jgi:hypothetical protein
MRRLALVTLVVATIGCGLAVLGELPLLLMSPMLFDASGARGSIGAGAIIAGLLAFPLLAGVGLLRGWRAFRGEAYRAALICLWMPGLGVGLEVAAISLFPAVCAADGELGCS